MHISKATVFRLLPMELALYRSKTENTAFEMSILLLLTMAAENTAGTVAASSSLPR